MEEWGEEEQGTREASANLFRGCFRVIRVASKVGRLSRDEDDVMAREKQRSAFCSQEQ
ncbi:hypothetical protein D4764_12G0005120 [Takifugu flavidus]|uniref:Uncharacterized protein n=1 Tax=Takifugu flavidus TaxID=433684 RepID=A0A5C6PBH1_9TELE|nr:hypothetical protein D4764_12G0005120 [Takifugu flavidus]